MKKIFQLLVVLLLFMQPMTIFAKAKQLTSTITWELKKDGTLIISGTGKMPDMDRDKYPWAKKAKKITSIKIGEGITYVGEMSFSSGFPSGDLVYKKNRHYMIVSVLLPSTLVEIGDYAFQCNKISSLSLPLSLKRVGYAAFRSNLIEELKIPEATISIGKYAFFHNQIKKLILPSTMKSIPTSFGYNNIRSLDIPNGVTAIGEWAFCNNKISTLNIPASVKSIGTAAFQHNNINKLNIPEGVTFIGSAVFEGSLSSSSTLFVPNSVESIGPAAFAIRCWSWMEIRDHFEGTILNLPSYITEDNCYEIGISSTAYRRYNPTAYDLYNKGYEYYDLENYKEALKYFLQGITARNTQLSNKSTFYQGTCALYAGWCYEDLGELENAKLMFEKAKELGNENASSNLSRVKDKLAQKEKDIAEEKFRKLAQEEFKRGNYEAAFKNYQELGKIGRANTEDWHFIPEFFENKGDYANAIKYYKKVYDIRKTNSLVERIAQLYLKTNNYKEAIEWESILAQTGNKESQYRLGKIYEKAKNKNLAIFWYKKAAEQKHLKAEEALAHYGVYINTQQSAPSSSQQTTQTSSSQSKTSSSSNQSNTYTPEYGLRDVWVSCWVCHGSGKCPSCNGNGQYVSTRYDGSFNSLDKCQPCYGSGRCYNCNGTGGHYEKQSYQIR